MERKHGGGRPKKACYTFKDGKIARHDDIASAGNPLGVNSKGGSHMRKMLGETGYYRPRSGGMAWLVQKDCPPEAKEALYYWLLGGGNEHH